MEDVEDVLLSCRIFRSHHQRSTHVLTFSLSYLCIELSSIDFNDFLEWMKNFQSSCAFVNPVQYGLEVLARRERESLSPARIVTISPPAAKSQGVGVGKRHSFINLFLNIINCFKGFLTVFESKTPTKGVRGHAPPGKI